MTKTQLVNKIVSKHLGITIEDDRKHQFLKGLKATQEQFNSLKEELEENGFEFNKTFKCYATDGFRPHTRLHSFGEFDIEIIEAVEEINEDEIIDNMTNYELCEAIKDYDDILNTIQKDNLISMIGKKVKAVTINGYEIKGVIYDLNENIIQVETEEDIYSCKFKDVEIIKEEKAKKVTTKLEYSSGKYEDFDCLEEKWVITYDRSFNMIVTASSKEDCQQVMDSFEDFIRIDGFQNSFDCNLDPEEQNNGKWVGVVEIYISNDFVNEEKEEVKHIYKTWKNINEKSF